MFQKTITYFSIVIIVIGFIFLANGLILATPPTQDPPGGNVPAPLNVGLIGQYKSGGLILNTGGATTGLIVSQGNVGIGTTDPGNSKLRVSQTTDGYDYGIVVINDTSTDYISMAVYGTDKGSIQVGDSTTWRDLLLNPHGGNVGIGTTNPRAKLHVANQIMVGTPDTQSLEEHRGKIFIPSRSATNKGGAISVMTYNKGAATDTCGEALGRGWVDVAESCKWWDWCAKLCFRYWQF